ncbi:hypothetical protein [Lysobacter sp. CA199]|uniref:hypothetical protein n=1 Tax=Lysobacter sp. CA199 TaxID=3455608 RepID=UPI003F8D2CA8
MTTPTERMLLSEREREAWKAYTAAHERSQGLCRTGASVKTILHAMQHTQAMRDAWNRVSMDLLQTYRPLILGLDTAHAGQAEA